VRFYLGTHETSWLSKVTVPLFISHQRLRKRVRMPVAAGPWALDSGGFTEVAAHGRYRFTVDDYVEAVARYREEIGQLEWAAPMDWMCEPFVIDKTGLSVREHQERTVQSYLDLRDRGPFIPVLQGWNLTDYHRCIDLYADAGVDLTMLPLVGVGSVCRRQSTSETAGIFHSLASRGLRLHGFGVKSGVARYGIVLASADSMAWSYRARRSPSLPGHTHKSCANCAEFALRWRDDLLATLAEHEENERAIPRLAA
jgi:hypothetical protein